VEKEPAARDAYLPSMGAESLYRRLDGIVDLRIRKDDDWTFSAKLQVDLGDVIGAELGDELTCFDGSGETDSCDVVVSGERSAGFLAEACNHVDHARGEASFFGKAR